jgi:hypothetical protein
MAYSEQDYNKLVTKVASYIEASQNEIDASQVKLAEFTEQKSSFVKRATQAAGVLAHHGVIERDSVNILIDKVAEDPSAVWDLVEKLASSVGTDALGNPAQEKMASQTSSDPWVREFFGYKSGNGMID